MRNTSINHMHADLECRNVGNNVQRHSNRGVDSASAAQSEFRNLRCKYCDTRYASGRTTIGTTFDYVMFELL